MKFGKNTQGGASSKYSGNYGAKKSVRARALAKVADEVHKNITVDALNSRLGNHSNNLKGVPNASKDFAQIDISKITLSEEFEQIIHLLENSNENLFITGRAGTGKSTLLSYFRANTKKNVVVLAPTGVAALNVRGQTIHGFFKFKIGVTEADVKKVPEKTIDGKLYSKIDMIIIDEISMVRADLFDCIEKFLWMNGKEPGKHFGGVQIVVIGDLFQLPPVVANGEHHIFETKYNSPFFFDSRAYKQGNFETVELTTVYRQHDLHFIEILDKIRIGEAQMHHLEFINKTCCDGYKPASFANFAYTRQTNGQQNNAYQNISNQNEGDYIDGEMNEDGEVVIRVDEFEADDIREDNKSNVGKSVIKNKAGLGKNQDKGQNKNKSENENELVVHLVSTNALAEKINMQKMESLKGAVKVYKGKLSGRFDERNAPVPKELVLKVGAQVMTLKNDPMGRWVNGDIGVVDKLFDDAVRIIFQNGRVETVEGNSWDMIKYEYDDIFERLGSEVVGQYTQIPVKLAWAITIHKSQGKSFDKAVIDLGNGAFAHGQAYVALSRVRTLEGIILRTPLQPRDIRIDERVRDFLGGYSR